MHADLVIPVKGLLRGKSRLRTGTARGTAGHADLVLALALDTVTAAASASGVARVLAVTSDDAAARALRREGVEVLAETPPYGLNHAIRQGEAVLRASGQGGQRVVGAMQADLPALLPADLNGAIAAAGGRRACCLDRHGTGTTLLLSGAGEPLDPAFGAGSSAAAHLGSGALRLTAPLPSLRCDVDTIEDLAVAATLGLGPRTAALADGLREHR